jgi:division/cell wall cluster transcriptional repressor MraZ
MELVEILRLISGPVIGAVIGLFTNWIAVKMLFRPRKALYIGKFHIPFTPGVIPRRQPALAKAFGKMVSEGLVRKEDLKESLCSDAVSHTVARSVMALPSIRTMGEQVFAEKYEPRRDRVLDFVADRIIEGILAMDLGEIITKEATETVNGFANANPLVKLFVNDQMIATLAAPIADKVTDYLHADGREKLREKLDALPASKSRQIKRFIFANAADVQCDSQGRVLISAQLRAYAGIEKNAVIIGVGSYLEIWAEEAWAAACAEEEAEDIAKMMEELDF